MRNWRLGIILLLALLSTGALVAVFSSPLGSGPRPAQASHTHFRFGSISWAPGAANQVTFTFTGAFRRNGYGGTAGDGFPAVGDVITETIGGTNLCFGDASCTGTLFFKVTSIDVANNWLLGLGGVNSGDTTISHTYAAAGTYTAFSSSCCRISAVVPPNEHINNPDGSYRMETLVTAGATNRSPVTSVPPIVTCPINAVCSFGVPTADADGDPRTCRLSTAAEAGPGFVQPGPPNAPNAASINANTCVYTWNTTGATLAGNPANTTLYSTQVTIEDRDGGGNIKSKIAADFLIRLVQAVGNPPVFDHPPTPACGSTIAAAVGAPVSFTVQASDPDQGDTVTLNVIGLPVGATMTPGLPTSGNPVSSAFSWTPTSAQVGSHVVTFTATDSTQQQVQCSVIIEVTETIIGGIVELLAPREDFPPAEASGSAAGFPAALALGAAAALGLAIVAVGGWYARRRFGGSS